MLIFNAHLDEVKRYWQEEATSEERAERDETRQRYERIREAYLAKKNQV